MAGLVTSDKASGLLRPDALSVTGLRKTFAGNPALDGIDLTVGPGEVHALLGENGSGKSTLIKILSGYHLPDPGGEVRIGGEELELGSADSSYRLGCRFVHQDLGLVDASSVLDNLSFNVGYPSRFGTIRTKAVTQRCRHDLQRVGLDIDPSLLVGGLSPAVKTGVALARALCNDGTAPAHLLVLDEPTATLPETEVRHLLEMVRAVAAEGVGVLYVTHRLDEVFDIADRVTVLRDGRKVATRPVQELDRAQLITYLVGRELELTSQAAQSLSVTHDDVVLRVRNLCAGRLRSLSFDAAAGEIIGVAGITGSGRESALPAIFGAVEREAGTVALRDQQMPSNRPDESIIAGIAYLPPDRKLQGGAMELTARENLTLSNLRPFWKGGLLRRSLETTEARSWFERLGVRPPGAYERPLATFSGGNQQKILFGKGLRCSPMVWLLDEPTQGVDVGAKAELHRQILAAAESGMVVIVSSSDADELVALCQRVLILRSGRLAASLSGDDVSVANVGHQSLGAEEELAS